jgi:hypothetical protein
VVQPKTARFPVLAWFRYPVDVRISKDGHYQKVENAKVLSQDKLTLVHAKKEIQDE